MDSTAIWVCIIYLLKPQSGIHFIIFDSHILYVESIVHNIPGQAKMEYKIE